jgi:hypothetical protein
MPPPAPFVDPAQQRISELHQCVTGILMADPVNEQNTQIRCGVFLIVGFLVGGIHDSIFYPDR